jgi:hypothetical protein
VGALACPRCAGPHPQLEAALDRLAKVPTLQGVDLFGSRQISGEKVQARLGTVIDAMARAAARQDPACAQLQHQVEDGIRAMGDFAYVKLSLITYFPPHGGQFITIDLVDAKDRPKRMVFAPAPQGSFPDPDGLLAAWADYQDKGMTLARQGRLAGRPWPSGVAYHIVFGFDDPALAPFLQRFNAGVAAHQWELVRILHEDRDVDHRGSAAFLLAHMRAGQDLVRELLPALRDPSELVRNNAMRVLSDVADHYPALDIPVTPVATALHYPSTTDRNKASAILYGLARRPACRAAIVREGPTLLEMLRLKQPNNHDYAYLILCELSGQKYGERDYATWEKWVRAQRP